MEGDEAESGEEAGGEAEGAQEAMTVLSRMNGWQRLWALAAALWGLFVAGMMATLSSDPAAVAQRWLSVAFGLAFWLVPVTFAYALGVAVAWVIAGFRAGQKR